MKNFIVSILIQYKIDEMYGNKIRNCLKNGNYNLTHSQKLDKCLENDSYEVQNRQSYHGPNNAESSNTDHYNLILKQKHIDAWKSEWNLNALKAIIENDNSYSDIISNINNNVTVPELINTISNIDFDDKWASTVP
jgi:hypothetical protein